jgi:CheY-like chemotaxis protein
LKGGSAAAVVVVVVVRRAPSHAASIRKVGSSLAEFLYWALPSLMYLPDRLRILVADDERLIADTLAMILNQSGYEAIPVYGGKLAVEKARHWPPDLFLGDVSMPELDGIQAAIEICALCPGCRILLFSGEPSSRILVRQASTKGHRFEFLDKPIPPLDLLNRIRRQPAA